MNRVNLKTIIQKVLKDKIVYFKTIPTKLRNPYENYESERGFLFLNINGSIYKVNLDDKKIREKITPIFVDENILKVGYDIKKEIFVLNNFGIGLEGGIFDILVAAYLLYPGKREYSLPHLASPSRWEGEDGGGGVKYFPELYNSLSKQLKENGLEFVFNKIETPLIKVLAKMEKTGIRLDVKFLDKMKKKVEIDLKKLENKIYKIAGQKFNLNSPKQLKTILFDKLKLNEKLRLRKTKTGISTAASELVKMRGLHPIVDLILEYRELFKLFSTYIEALPKLVNPKTEKLHAQFNQTITATGRLSSSEPNLQNIPVRAGLGQQIRKAFVADKNFVLLAADYSQIELRIAAHLSGDKEMIEAFNCRKGGSETPKGVLLPPRDFHTHTAAQIFGVFENKVTSEMRRLAKTVNFGVLYGMGPAALAESTGMPYSEAQDFISQYFALYQGVYEYIEQTKALARSLGYVETLFGRRRYLPEITSGLPQIRAAAERMAINHPVQGMAADLIKMAMIEIDEEIEIRGWENSVKMLLQVHDELVFEVSVTPPPFERGRKIPLNPPLKKGEIHTPHVPPLIKGEIEGDFIKQAAKMIKEKMETVYKLRVPLEAEVKTGRSWGELSKMR